MFRDTSQQTRAIRALLAYVRLEHLWTWKGPTPEAVTLLRDNGGHLSTSETIFLKAAFDFSDRNGGCALNSMLNVLDHSRLQAICSLALAVCDVADAYGAVDRWLARHEPAPVRAVPEPFDWPPKGDEP